MGHHTHVAGIAEAADGHAEQVVDAGPDHDLRGVDAVPLGECLAQVVVLGIAVQRRLAGGTCHFGDHLRRRAEQALVRAEPERQGPTGRSLVGLGRDERLRGRKAGQDPVGPERGHARRSTVAANVGGLRWCVACS